MPSQEHEDLVALLSSAGGAITAPSVAEQRASMEAMMGGHAIGPDIAVTSARAGSVPIDVLHAAHGRSDRALLYLHGGGYALGSARTHRELGARLARASGLDVYMADYRLAPEHPFPAAVDDALAAYRHVLERGIAPRSVAIGGDSAGGGLTFATLLAIRGAGLPLPACAFGFSPWVDLEGLGASAQPDGADDPMIRLDGLRESGRQYAGDRLRDPLASPLHGDLAGLPPLLIQVGTRELLLDDATRFASRAWSAGVDVELHVYAGLVHVWQAIPHLPEAGRAVAAAADFLRRHVG